MTKFKIGDRVAINSAFANGFGLPYRKWAQQHRKATVIARSPTNSGETNAVLQFDVTGKPKRETDYRVSLEDRYLLFVESVE